MATPFRQDGSPVKRVAVLAAKRAVVWRRGFSQGDLRCFVKTGVVGRDLLGRPTSLKLLRCASKSGLKRSVPWN